MAAIYPVMAAENDAALYARGQTILSESTQDKHQRDGADLITRAAEAGHAPAQFHLGFLYGKGRGVLRDPKRAVHWFRRAAEQGHAKAQYAVGLALLQQTDKREGVKWLRRAAVQGVVDAMFQLGLLLEKGDGVGIDEVEARRLYRTAADKRDTAAMFNLAIMLDEGRGGPPDLRGAIDLYVRAAPAART